ncbi:Tim44/TimA family putative adaptor protein [Roseovarius sp. LXJ103]|uniref:Tim44/TimA family putative adaptor protein n=1 Tax=Roseovarius carneus TaxID=2853164 RepID=UPI000D60BFF4|nr:Tim44/TimA family putative adaptor protein [Roseovarius carneus]MBZ8117928.1 Tim44/TimA family putative adaptor protein [Roseovarius carneus]PWE36318.1 preprotein translocase subunit Tim44 [Pelagicola sp. LXJ1103]
MNTAIIQLLVLAGIAVFLILRLRSVLGTREGFETPPAPIEGAPARRNPGFEVIEGGPDHDIIDHVPEDSEAAAALAEMKRAEPSFAVGEFLSGARGAYEMILMGFENGDMEQIRPLLGDDVAETFDEVIKMRKDQGLTIEAEFLGVREVSLHDATFVTETGEANVVVKFIGELTSVVYNAKGDLVEGEAGKSKRQKDIWTFERMMGTDDPNWRLVATGE